MAYLDTHIAIWLYGGDLEIFSEKVKDILEKEPLFISPIVQLEMQYLYEISKIKKNASEIFSELQTHIDLRICGEPFPRVVDAALKESWTRDPFDRMIVAQARLSQGVLLTKDLAIQKNYSKAMW